ncbi:MAG: tRNA-(ms[2]io[6]A)-hydroxylase [Planctomycetaceae bacterium]|nr:tRNA-(ms[2]io[6]A)-hydroxylase [Planctomycetaceae bacterium]
MLHLDSESSERWLQQALAHPEELLIDHAHCEQKAAGAAMDLMFDYVEDQELCREMTEIINEELDHFHQVLALINRRGIRFRRLKPGPYGKRLKELVRRQEPLRAVDRLLIAGLIEARSCERFVLLREHHPDAELRAFYGSLYESEARHHATYVRLAKHFARDAEVADRLRQLAHDEAAILAAGSELPRMHS